jgi:hypothetical protein
VGSAPGAQALAKGKAPVAPPAVRLSAPIKSKNAQAQQSQQRFMNNVRQQNALAASTYNALLTEQGAEGLVQAGIIKPEVLTINKQQPKGYVFRPGTAVTIYGRGFGSGGQVRLLGGFRKAPALIVNENDWRPSVIYARLADDIRGEEDLDDVRLEIQPSGKSAITVPGARFEAARETTLLKDIPQRYVTLPGQQARYTTAQRDIPGLGSTYALESINAKSAIVSRYSGSDNWFAPGTDVYALALKPGFMIDSYEYWHGATSTNPSECMEHNGGEYFQGRYGVTIAAVNVVKVDWGVWRCHISPGLWTSNQNFNYSFYGLNIYVIGPRGLDPWK